MASADTRQARADMVSRRGIMLSALALAAGGAAPAAATAARASRRPVVAFHADRLYLDHRGAEPYRPPAGLRSLDGLDEEGLRRLLYHP